ncbi:MAG TPA: response regulator transcription factor [Solirubrobacteraceae bacterium]|nr:response regulator transcription factor [Solirubrobacteraceae bacterium]
MPSVQTNTISVVIVDDHEVVRDGLAMVIEAAEGIEVLATAGEIDAALRLTRAHRPDVLLLDLLMPGESVMKALPRFAEVAPETAIVILTMSHKPEHVREALRAGVRGYVLKEAAGIDLVQAVRFAHEGRTYLSPSLGASMAAQQDGPPDGLAKRELDVLRLLALGHTNAEIAGQLQLSPRTVESYRARIQQKTDRFSRAELVRYAFDNELLGEAGGITLRAEDRR